MDYNVLKSAIASVIKQNGNKEITGNILQSVLLTMVDSLGEGRQFVGVVTAAVLPLQTDAKAERVGMSMAICLKFHPSAANTS